MQRMTVIKAVLSPGGCKFMFFGEAVPARLAKDFCPREKIFKA
jgi:hypothetical protein